MLIPPQRSYYVLTPEELDDLVNQHFNKTDFESIAEYHFNDNEEYTHVVSINRVAEGTSGRALVQEFINYHTVPIYSPHWSLLLAELARRGEIPEGTYLISVFS